LQNRTKTTQAKEDKKHSTSRDLEAGKKTEERLDTKQQCTNTAPSYSSKCPMGSKFVASRTSKSARDLKYLIKSHKSILKLQTWAFLDMTLNL